MRFGRKTNKADSIPARRLGEQRTSSVSESRPSAADLSNRYAFRRNRTLTGSSSAQIMSSNELNAELKSPRAHIHHLTSLRRRLLMYFILVGVAAFGLYILLAQTVASEVIQVKGVALLPESIQAEYRKSIEAYYSARPAERLRLLLDENRLTSHVQASHPEVASVRVEPSKLGEAVVTITARQPIARWSIDNSNQYVDSDGIVFSRNYYEEPTLRIVDNSGVQANQDHLVASNRFLGFVGRLIAAAADRNLVINKVTIPAGTTRQVAVTFKGRATEYKVSVDRSAGQQVEDIAHIVPYLAAHGLQPGYVDVRIEGKAFYR